MGGGNGPNRWRRLRAQLSWNAWLAQSVEHVTVRLRVSVQTSHCTGRSHKNKTFKNKNDLKKEYTYVHDHWLIYATAESLDCTPKIAILELKFLKM